MRELIEFAEVSDGPTDEWLFTIVIWKEDEEYYQVQLSTQISQQDFDINSVEKPSRGMDMTRFRGMWRSGLTEVSSALLGESYIKRPNLLDYDTGDLIGKILVREAEVAEKLKILGKHPNICEYRGCVREGSYITGLAFKRYASNLNKVVSSLGIKDRRAVYKGVVAGLNFLHKNGFVHNDINPTNIMLDDDMIPVIIDLNSCYIIGEERSPYSKDGTPGWSRRLDLSAPYSNDPFANDAYSLDLIHNFIFPECSPISPGLGKDNSSQTHVCG